MSLGVVGVGSTEVIAGLLTILKEDEAEDVRYYVAQSLGQVGSGSTQVIAGLLTTLKEDKSANVRYRVVESLVRLAQIIADESSDILLDALKNSNNWAVRRDAARLIGRFGKNSEQYIQSLHRKLLDRDSDVRIACVHGLVLFARRFPATYATIEKLFIQAIEQPKFDKKDDISERSAHDYAYDGLWLLVVGGEIEDEDE